MEKGETGSGDGKLKSFGYMFLGWAIILVLLAALILGATEAPVVVAALVAGLASVIGLLWQRFDERKRNGEDRRREKLAPIYEELVSTFIASGREGKVDEDALEKFWGDLSQRLILWGDPDVILAFNQWRDVIAASEEETPEAGVAAFFVLLMVLRSDLGQSNEGLSAQDVLKIVMKPDEDPAVVLDSARDESATETSSP